MGYLGEIFVMAMTAIFIQNFVLSRFLGLCPYLGVSKKLDSALGMGMAVIFVMTLASAITFLINKYLLLQFDLMYLQTIAFILTIAALVQFVEMVIQKNAPALYKSLGVFLPLITTNCAVLGVAILNTTAFRSDGISAYNFLDSVLNGFFSGLGFTVVLLAMAGLRMRLEKAELPKSMKGMPIALILAGIMALSFYGFMGFKI
ncbi:MAG: RnfABCDGE type electron transport complex subunit A [Candidatus Cloacimonadaceae bacterium]|jgi:electron transport complex protein RnfA|nr:RnfABCDGE type electron transport complex subunit A [Candidatus Cloacimonadota bacterium]MCK9434288.1 RnfABCDGE type electron transport complex subunit A [Candidatus Cloacimonadota bacterium]MDD2616837.1 RnfABCDGE type electron transport complex subunit A [Candidatus Cloacimonadota bacterium]MDD3547805.1 RnfABCDGE type electron transport complex subunit A [Candidatus Cloacimonadota bacterium]MDD4233465.1 RnfABCDGE type electron transport complex subunit A [Candidatus Cloacimonadota bacterium